MLNFQNDWQNWLNDGTDKLSLINQALKDAERNYSKSLRTFASPAERGDWLRVSSIGKPAFSQLAVRFFGHESEPLNFKKLSIFHAGNSWEGEFHVVATLMGYKPVMSQREIVWNGVKGHIDTTLTDPHTGSQWLVELKTMKQESFNTLLSKGIAAFPTYVSQLAIYSFATGFPGAWVVQNKNNGDIATVILDKDTRDKALSKAEKYVKAFQKVNTWHDVYRYFRPPVVEPMMRSGEVVGFKVPYSMVYSPHLDKIYCLKAGNKLSWATPTVYPHYQVPKGFESLRDSWLKELPR